MQTKVDGKECEIDEKVKTKIDGKECEIDGKELGDGTQKCEIDEKVNIKVDGQECDKEIDECGTLVDGHFVVQSGKVGLQTQISEEKTQLLFFLPWYSGLSNQILHHFVLGCEKHVASCSDVEVVEPYHAEPVGQPHLLWSCFAKPFGRLVYNDVHKLQPLPAACKAIPKNIKKMKEVEHVCILFCSGKSCFCSLFWKVACNYSGQCCYLFWQYFVCVCVFSYLFYSGKSWFLLRQCFMCL